MAGFVGHYPKITVTGPKPLEVNLPSYSTQKVACPHCGHASVVIMDRDKATGGVQILDFKQPRHCEGCGKLFILNWRLQIGASKLEA